MQHIVNGVLGMYIAEAGLIASLKQLIFYSSYRHRHVCAYYFGPKTYGACVALGINAYWGGIAALPGFCTSHPISLR